MSAGRATFVRGVGVASVLLGAVGAVAPRGLAAAGGVRTADGDAALPLLVRLAAARQVALGVAILTRTPVDVPRSAGLFLPITALDAAAVLAAARGSQVAPRAVVASLLVLGTNVAVSVAARRGR